VSDTGSAISPAQTGPGTPAAASRSAAAPADLAALPPATDPMASSIASAPVLALASS
jgi:hypothetical protein